MLLVLRVIRDIWSRLLSEQLRASDTLMGKNIKNLRPCSKRCTTGIGT